MHWALRCKPGWAGARLNAGDVGGAYATAVDANTPSSGRLCGGTHALRLAALQRSGPTVGTGARDGLLQPSSTSRRSPLAARRRLLLLLLAGGLGASPMFSTCAGRRRRGGGCVRATRKRAANERAAVGTQPTPRLYACPRALPLRASRKQRARPARAHHLLRVAEAGLRRHEHQLPRQRGGRDDAREQQQHADRRGEQHAALAGAHLQAHDGQAAALAVEAQRRVGAEGLGQPKPGRGAQRARDGEEDARREAQHAQRDDAVGDVPRNGPRVLRAAAAGTGGRAGRGVGARQQACAPPVHVTPVSSTPPGARAPHRPSSGMKPSANTRAPSSAANTAASSALEPSRCAHHALE